MSDPTDENHSQTPTYTEIEARVFNALDEIVRDASGTQHGRLATQLVAATARRWFIRQQPMKEG